MRKFYFLAVIGFVVIATTRFDIHRRGYDTFDTTWIFGILCCGLISLYWLWQRTNWLFTATAGWVLYSAAAVGLNRFNIYSRSSVGVRDSIMMESLMTLVYCLGVTVPLLLLPIENYRKEIGRGIGVACIVDIYLSTIKTILGDHLTRGLPSGFIDIAGMNAGFIGLTILSAHVFIQEFFNDFKYALYAHGITFLLAYYVAFSAHSSIGLGVLTLSYFLWICFAFKIGKYIGALFVGGIGAIAAWRWSLHELFSDSFRFQAYKTFMGWWSDNINLFTGSGLGTFKALAGAIQLKTFFAVHPSTGDSLMIEYYRQMHSDWLEILFETGSIGLLLAGCLWIWSIKKTESILGKVALINFGAFMVFYYPLHWFHTAIIGAYLLVKANLRGNAASAALGTSKAGTRKSEEGEPSAVLPGGNWKNAYCN